MASFAIADSPTTLQLAHSPGRWSAIATFSVTNITASAKTALLRIRPDAAAGSRRFTIESETLCSFAPAETRALPIRFAIADDVSPGDVVFQVRVVNEADPNNDWADGAAVRVRIPALRTPPPAEPDDPPDDTVFYEDADNRIDAHFAKFGTKTIPIRAITAIETESRRPRRMMALFALAGAGLCILYGFSEEEFSGLVAALVLAIMAWTQWRRRSLRLVLTTSAGPIRPLDTNDAKIVGAIRAAMERALRT